MTTPTERGHVAFSLGGQKRLAKVSIEMALDVEAATGLGVMAIMRSYLDGAARLTWTVEILRLALASNGQVYTSNEVRDMIGLDGIVAATADAAVIVGAFMGGGSKKKQPPKESANGRATTSP